MRAHAPKTVLLLSNAFAFSMHAAPTAAPRDLKMHPSPRSALVTWDPPPVEDWNGIVTQYRIYSSSTGYATIYDNHCELTSLTPLTLYTVRVAAVTSGGTGYYTSYMTFYTSKHSLQCMCEMVL